MASPSPTDRRSRRAQRARRIRTVTAGAVALLAAAGIAITLVERSGSSEPGPAAATRPRATSTTITTTPPTTTTVPPTTTTTVAATGTLASVAGKTVLIDPGHNGKNFQHPEINQPVDIGTQQRACDTTGTQTYDGYTESAYNLDVSLRVAQLLRAAGANVVMTRSDNESWGPCINQRAAIGNDAHADAGISIHADGGPDGGRGFHMIYPPSIAGLTDDIAESSKRLALAVRATYHDETGMPYADYLGSEGMSERSDLGGLNLSNIPKVFIETGNMRNATDSAMLKDEAFRQRAAVAIADGLAAFLAGR
jgi:N-acetylmuramoyl-L-alanine amidase